MADASALGIHPPHTVHIAWEGWEHDWPHETVDVLGDRLAIKAITGVFNYHDGRITSRVEEPVILYFPYEHARELPDGSWIFHGGATHRDFTVSAGPPQPPSLN